MSRYVIICGGRDHPAFSDRQFAWLDGLHDAEVFAEVITGGASGVDSEGERWARARGIDCVTFWPNWAAHGTSAGPQRNQRMLLYAMGQADTLRLERSVLVIAFPGGPGTRDMVHQARRWQVAVMTWDAVAGGTDAEETL
jgi:predicted Rossmann-fold nucleotide-binding protein